MHALGILPMEALGPQPESSVLYLGGYRGFSTASLQPLREALRSSMHG